jgi:hypothetical protein
MKRLLLGMIWTLVSLPAIAQTPTYMGTAATGEAVYYNGDRFQCGDLPQHHECWWRSPMISYTIGGDTVTAIGDCQEGFFSEVYVDGELVASDMRPQSEAIRLVLENACRSDH